MTRIKSFPFALLLTLAPISVAAQNQQPPPTATPPHPNRKPTGAGARPIAALTPNLQHPLGGRLQRGRRDVHERRTLSAARYRRLHEEVALRALTTRDTKDTKAFTNGQPALSLRERR